MKNKNCDLMTVFATVGTSSSTCFCLLEFFSHPGNVVPRVWLSFSSGEVSLYVSARFRLVLRWRRFLEKKNCSLRTQYVSLLCPLVLSLGWLNVGRTSGTVTVKIVKTVLFCFCPGKD